MGTLTVWERDDVAALVVDRDRVVRVMAHIQEHLSEPLALNDLAALAGRSAYHFHRIFRALAGESLGQFIKRVRMERAAHRLRDTDLAILAIGLEVGYESAEGFSRAFRSWAGTSPREYRRRQRRGEPIRHPRARPHTRTGLRIERALRVEHLEPIRIAYLRRLGAYQQIGRHWARLLAKAGRLGWLRGDRRRIGIAHDDPDLTPPDQLRFDAGIEIDAHTSIPPGFGEAILPGGPHARLVVRGSYDQMAAAYDHLYGPWLFDSPWEPAEHPTFLVYRAFGSILRPSDALTELCLPLRRRSTRDPSAVDVPPAS